MIIDYINKTFENAEPIFLSELPCNSQESLRQEMKKLTDEGKLIRLYNGVYYKPYKTIIGTEGRMSIHKYIEKKYIYNNKKVSGFISGLGLYNKYGFTSQVPSVIEVTSNIKDAMKDAADKLYADLKAAGVEVVLDDRDERPGVKFADADLIGYPVRVTVGDKNLPNVEIKMRNQADPVLVPLEEAGARIAAMVKAELDQLNG